MSLIPPDPAVEIPLSLPEAYDALRTQLVYAPHDGRPLIRIRVPVSERIPLEWLAAQSVSERFYWHPRNSSSVWAGVGVARKYEGSDALQQAMAFLGTIQNDEDEDPRFFGGLPFAAGKESPEWQSFRTGWFVLPRFEFYMADSEATLILNVLVGDETQQVLAEINALKFPIEIGPWSAPGISEQTTLPDFSSWQSGIEHALAECESGTLDKVVLARKKTYVFDEPLDPEGILSELQQRTPGCTHFLFQGEEGAAFIGATPERLFRLDHTWLYTEAIAGTRKRGDTDIEDEQLADELLTDPKERHEHELVRDYIIRTLEPFAVGIEAGKTDVLRLSSKRHLYTPIAAILHPGVTADDLLGALHPTPAVAGFPADAAIKHIQDAEAFDRGWYAGPIGWISAESAEFFVAIRSGLITTGATHSSLKLYSGAGIVPGSVAQSEWAEVETKLSDFLRVISPTT